MKTVLLTGGTGFIGKKLTERLIARGDRVTILTRDPSRAAGRLPRGASAVGWDPEREGPWFDEVARASAVVHLAGETVAQRWTPEARRRIEQSRVVSTRLVVEAIGRAAQKPTAFVSASGIGIYGARPPEETLDESSKRGEGFLVDVVERWEAEAQRAEEHGVRTTLLRIGIVLGEDGGPLEKMIMPFKLFAGGPIGTGDQVVSWIHSDDVVGLVLFALDDERARGPINAVAPSPVTNRELASAIGRAMGRPSWFRAPTALVKLAMGEAAEMVTTGLRVVPKRAVELGYTFVHPALDPALASILRR
ncbi:TIGR01777 family oxidoreductase [Polyangium aurulentum]|uniref:TIGR01777 family oxidoreductase n=1 Tax=Polyangium aurulentum TaxID=2567896 RepID=UPI0010AE6EE0|nr:TIGR01777 family oxidoreductase [Polyangium aurulentum]UQA59748.1 TIGR01777 family oxidoreductase [Polyangium aurulentum]